CGTVNVAPCNVLGHIEQNSGVQCHGGTASITVYGTAGSGSYTGTGTFAVTAGTHTYTVADANDPSCYNVTSITISEPDVLVASSSQGPAIHCNGGTTTVNVTATGGTTPYGGDAGVHTVGAGTYSYTVVDDHGCTSVTSITVSQPTQLIASASGSIACHGETVTASGGTPPYTGTGPMPGQGAGTHNYTVTDANGCTAIATITLTEPSQLMA